jgi:hypothetical protein
MAHHGLPSALRIITKALASLALSFIGRAVEVVASAAFAISATLERRRNA